MEEDAVAWPSFFAPGGTIAVCAAQLDKGRHPMGTNTTWGAKAVAAASDRFLTPCPAVAKGQLTPSPVPHAEPGGQLILIKG